MNFNLRNKFFVFYFIIFNLNYFRECSEASPSRRAKDETLAVKLWEESLRRVGLPEIENLDSLLKTISEPRN